MAHPIGTFASLEVVRNRDCANVSRAAFNPIVKVPGVQGQGVEVINHGVGYWFAGTPLGPQISSGRAKSCLENRFRERSRRSHWETHSSLSVLSFHRFAFKATHRTSYSRGSSAMNSFDFFGMLAEQLVHW